MMSELFINPSGQRDNLGDSILRRYYLKHLRQVAKLHILIGDHPGYVSGLAIKPEDTTYGSKAAFISALLKPSRGRKRHFAMNAGEIVSSPSHIRTFAWQSLAIASAQQSGGRIVALGIGIRDSSRIGDQAITRQLREADMVTWRDYESRVRVSASGSVQPDWAFATEADDPIPTDASRRRLLAVALRGDRGPITAHWIETIREVVRAADLKLVIVVQVARDQELAFSLANHLGGSVIQWSGTSHHDQEQIVREVYRQSRFVFSDRLHALIVGASEGAVPVGVDCRDLTKSRNVFFAAGWDHISPPPDVDSHPAGYAGWILSQDPHRHASLFQNARSEVAAIGSRLLDMVN